MNPLSSAFGRVSLGDGASGSRGGVQQHQQIKLRAGKAGKAPPVNLSLSSSDAGSRGTVSFSLQSVGSSPLRSSNVLAVARDPAVRPDPPRSRVTTTPDHKLRATGAPEVLTVARGPAFADAETLLAPASSSLPGLPPRPRGRPRKSEERGLPLSPAADVPAGAGGVRRTDAAAPTAEPHSGGGSARGGRKGDAGPAPSTAIGARGEASLGVGSSATTAGPSSTGKDREQDKEKQRGSAGAAVADPAVGTGHHPTVSVPRSPLWAGAAPPTASAAGGDAGVRASGRGGKWRPGDVAESLSPSAPAPLAVPWLPTSPRPGATPLPGALYKGPNTYMREGRRAWGDGDLKPQSRVAARPKEVGDMERSIYAAPLGTGAIAAILAKHHAERPLDMRVGTTMITHCGRREEAKRKGDVSQWWQRGEEVFTALAALGIEHNTFTYSALISTLGKGKQLQKALDLFGDMLARRVTPNVVTFSSLISACEKAGDWQRAMDVFQHMMTHRVTPNLTTYNSLISACEKGAQWELALEVYRWMLAQGPTARADGTGTEPSPVPDVYTYSALISACEKGGQAELALQLFERMAECRVEANVVTYSALISACAKGGQTEKAEIVFELMRQRQCAPNTTTYNSMICAWQKGGKLDAALAALAEMKRLHVYADTITYSSLISACEKAGRFEVAVDLFREMEEKRIPANSITYSSLLEAACAAGEQEQALVIYQAGMRVDGHDGAVWANYIADLSAEEAYKIDVHGLSEMSARVAILSWLRNLHAEQGRGRALWSLHSYAHIITGWGKHNDDGQSRVKEAAWAFLTVELGPPLKCWIPEDNIGVILCTTHDLYAWLFHPETNLYGPVPSLSTCRVLPRDTPPSSAQAEA